MVVFAIAIFLGVSGFVALQLLGDQGAKTIGWIAYGILYLPLLIFGIRHLNRLHGERDGTSPASRRILEAEGRGLFPSQPTAEGGLSRALPGGFPKTTPLPACQFPEAGAAR